MVVLLVVGSIILLQEGSTQIQFGSINVDISFGVDQLRVFGSGI